jgi:thymidylate synthase (FAD)
LVEVSLRHDSRGSAKVIVLTEPEVHLLSEPKFYDHPKYILPDGGTDSERLIAHGGKGCYDSYGADGRGIDLHIGNIIKTRHGSVLEHANVSLWITGISRGCSHEIVRHRAGFAYSQRSTRYTAEGQGSIVLEPAQANLYKRLGKGEATMDEAAIIRRTLRQAEEDFATYDQLVDWWFEEAHHLKGTDRRKWARGKARQSLPHSLETRMTMTGNLRAWRFFLEQRSERFAEAEIRRLASHIMPVLSQVAPLVFGDMLVGMELIDGFPEYKSPARKV